MTKPTDREALADAIQIAMLETLPHDVLRRIAPEGKCGPAAGAIADAILAAGFSRAASRPPEATPTEEPIAWMSRPSKEHPHADTPPHIFEGALDPRTVHDPGPWWEYLPLYLHPAPSREPREDTARLDWLETNAGHELKISRDAELNGTELLRWERRYLTCHNWFAPTLRQAIDAARTGAPHA